MPDFNTFFDKRERLTIAEIIELIQKKHIGIKKEDIATGIGRNRTYLSKPISEDEERQVKALLIYRFLQEPRSKVDSLPSTVVNSATVLGEMRLMQNKLESIEIALLQLVDRIGDIAHQGKGGDDKNNIVPSEQGPSHKSPRKPARSK